MTDTETLRRNVDLLSLVGSDTRLHKAANTRGGEYAGACPFCGGHDRLRVQPAQGMWFCRQCSDRWSDAIGYVQKRDSVDFREACARLNSGAAASSTTERAPIIALPTSVAPPDAAWRASGLQVVEECESALWSDAGSAIRRYLAGRGLREDTIRRARLGYNGAQRRVGAHLVVPGVTIPWFVDGELWNVKIRLNTAGKGPEAQKYSSIAGGHPMLYGAGTLADHEMAVLCEGEFDALLLEQEVGDLVGVATLGSAKAGLSAQAMRYLLPVSPIFAAYDLDQPGEEGAQKLTALSRRIRRIRSPMGKDITAFWQAGGSLRDWITVEIARLSASAPTERPNTYHCDVSGCGLALAEPRDPDVGGFCLRHYDRLQVLNVALLMDWPRVPLGFEGAAAWRSYVRDVNADGVAHAFAALTVEVAS